MKSMFVWIVLIGSASASEQVIWPEGITKCTNRDSFSTLYERFVHTNPAYLRGDFDGDRRIDYAFAIKSKTDGSEGVAICDAKRKLTILGAGSKPAFSDVPGDHFLTDWIVVGPSETHELEREISTQVRLKADALYFVWEDGVGLIYWDGRKYMWIGAVLNN
jgi:hypothetical protein